MSTPCHRARAAAPLRPACRARPAGRSGARPGPPPYGCRPVRAPATAPRRVPRPPRPSAFLRMPGCAG
jgi:hypothetical protein